MSGTHLQQVDVSIDHGHAKVTLNVSHGLTLDLDAVAHPNATHDLIKGSLTTQWMLHEQ